MISRHVRYSLAAVVFCVPLFSDDDPSPTDWFWSTAVSASLSAPTDRETPPPANIQPFPSGTALHAKVCQAALDLPDGSIAITIWRDVQLCNAGDLKGKALSRAVSTFYRQVNADYKALHDDKSAELTMALLMSLLGWGAWELTVHLRQHRRARI